MIKSKNLNKNGINKISIKILKFLWIKARKAVTLSLRWVTNRNSNKKVNNKNNNSNNNHHLNNNKNLNKKKKNKNNLNNKRKSNKNQRLHTLMGVRLWALYTMLKIFWKYFFSRQLLLCPELSLKCWQGWSAWWGWFVIRGWLNLIKNMRLMLFRANFLQI